MKYSHALFVFFLLGIGSAQAGTKITAADAISLPGNAVELQAKFEFVLGTGYLVHPNLGETSVVFSVDGHTGRVKTDETGVARFTTLAPKEPGTYSYRCWLVGEEEDPSHGILFVADPKRPLVIADVDGTLSSQPQLLVPLAGWFGGTYAGAPELIRELFVDYQIVYLTARDDWFACQTRTFLERQGFVRAPVLFNKSGFSDKAELSQLVPKNHGKFKRQAIEGLLGRGFSVALGIGDASTDAEAYEGAGLNSYIHRPDGDLDGLHSSHAFANYAELREQLLRDGFLTEEPQQSKTGLADAIR